MNNTMRRWELDALGSGNLALREVPIPEPAPGQLLVRVEAVALNHRDQLVIETGRGLSLDFPFTPGSDFAGTVVRHGDHTSSPFQAGDRVISTFTPDWLDGTRPGSARQPWYRTLGGVYPGVLADYVALPESWFVAAPTTWTDAEAATLPCSGLTAWFALVERGQLQPRHTVLVEGTGGVALFALHIARARGATVLVSTTPDKFDRALALGAHHAVDRRRPDWTDAILSLTQDRGVDHVLELVGGPHLAQAVAVTAVGGRISLIGALEGFEIAAPLMPILLKDITLQGIATGHRRALTDLVRFVDNHEWRPTIASRHPLAELPLALDRLHQGPFGKIIIELN